ncbi:MAG: hypothetical protein QG597_4497 [Actinomycetota bacterium]|nr:hypothetical protein [Actinomycetota bacterium]
MVLTLSGCIRSRDADFPDRYGLDVDSVGAESADFCSVVLRGRNVASFKFALAKSILTLAESGKTAVSLEELAVPVSGELCSHIR